MVKIKTKKIDKPISPIEEFSSKLPYIDLSQKQSVRTTFNLKKETFQSIEWLANYYNITQKEVIDHLVGTVQDLADIPEGDESYLKSITDKIFTKTKKPNYLRKTKVVGKKSLQILKTLSKKEKISRDTLIEAAVIFHKFGLKKRKEKHAEALDEIHNLMKVIYKTEKKLKSLLDTDDPIIGRFGNIAVVAENLVVAVESEIEKGYPIDPDIM